MKPQNCRGEVFWAVGVLRIVELDPTVAPILLRTQGLVQVEVVISRDVS